MFIQTEAMPDPAAMKFLPGCQVLAEGNVEMRSSAQAANSPLATRLFEIPHVSGVVLGDDFIIVTKDGGDWATMRPTILGKIMDHFTSGAPVIEQASSGPAEGLVDQVRERLRRVIDPELGYNIVDLGLVYDIVAEAGTAIRVIMTTTTPGCPATDYLMEGARESAVSVSGIGPVEIRLTYEPRWTPEMMSPAAKKRFGVRDGGDW